MSENYPSSRLVKGLWHCWQEGGVVSPFIRTSHWLVSAWEPFDKFLWAGLGPYGDRVWVFRVMSPVEVRNYRKSGWQE